LRHDFFQCNISENRIKPGRKHDDLLTDFIGAEVALHMSIMTDENAKSGSAELPGFIIQILNIQMR